MIKYIRPSLRFVLFVEFSASTGVNMGETLGHNTYCKYVMVNYLLEITDSQVLKYVAEITAHCDV